MMPGTKVRGPTLKAAGYYKGWLGLSGGVSLSLDVLGQCRSGWP